MTALIVLIITVIGMVDGIMDDTIRMDVSLEATTEAADHSLLLSACLFYKEDFQSLALQDDR